MAAVTKGTAHLFGVVSGTVTTATVLSFSLKSSFALSATTEDETGKVIERRYDDRTSDATIELKIQSGLTLPALGDVITFNSIKYILESLDRKEDNKSHVIVTYSLKTSEGITLA